MTLIRRFHFTPEDLTRVETYHVASSERWEGDEVEYALDRSDWERQKKM
jgi:hypothetical protein